MNNFPLKQFLMFFCEVNTFLGFMRHYKYLEYIKQHMCIYFDKSS